MPSKRILKLNAASSDVLPPIKGAVAPESRDELMETKQKEGGDVSDRLPEIDQPYRDESGGRMEPTIVEVNKEADPTVSSTGSRLS